MVNEMSYPSPQINPERESSQILSDAKQGAAFVALRGFDNALWIGSVAGGIAIEKRYGVPAAIVAPSVATGVTSIGYAVSGQAVRFFRDDAPSLENTETDTPENRTGKVLKELSALGYAAWSGATSTVELNNSLGLESTRKRRLGQAAIYGVGTSLWTTNIPPFEQLREVVIDAGNYTIENPIQGTAMGALGSLGIFAIMKGIKYGREKFQEFRAARKASKIAAE